MIFFLKVSNSKDNMNMNSFLWGSWAKPKLTHFLSSSWGHSSEQEGTGCVLVPLLTQILWQPHPFSERLIPRIDYLWSNPLKHSVAEGLFQQSCFFLGHSFIYECVQLRLYQHFLTDYCLATEVALWLITVWLKSQHYLLMSQDNKGLQGQVGQTKHRLIHFNRTMPRLWHLFCVLFWKTFVKGYLRQML